MVCSASAPHNYVFFFTLVLTVSLWEGEGAQQPTLPALLAFGKRKKAMNVSLPVCRLPCHGDTARSLARSLAPTGVVRSSIICIQASVGGCLAEEGRFLFLDT